MMLQRKAFRLGLPQAGLLNAAFFPSAGCAIGLGGPDRIRRPAAHFVHPPMIRLVARRAAMRIASSLT
jgi:hypothetical protein